MKAHGPTTETPDEDREVTIALDLRRWNHLLMCLDHYLGILHGSAEIPDQVQSDGEWPGRVQAIARELRSLVYAGEDQRPLSLGLSEAVTEFTPGVSPPSEPQRGKAWTAEENLAVVDAYFWMLENQIASREYRKIDKYRELMAGTLSARSRQSIEYKMRNISAILESLGLTWLEGLKPLSNYQTDLSAAVDAFLGQVAMLERVDRVDKP